MIKVADNRTLSAHAVGTAILPLLDDNNRTHFITLHNVIYHPNFNTYLISVRRLMERQPHYAPIWSTDRKPKRPNTKPVSRTRKQYIY